MGTHRSQPSGRGKQRSQQLLKRTKMQFSMSEIILWILPSRFCVVKLVHILSNTSLENYNIVLSLQRSVFVTNKS